MASVTFDILAVDKASKVIDHVGNRVGKLGGVVGTLGKAAAGAAAGGVAILGLAIAKGVKDAADYQTLALKTAAVLKSTGNAAGTSVAKIQAHAAALESLSGVDETLIINSQNVLATFTQIQNTKTDKVFDQATQAALNLSVAMGSDLQSATVQVGKALNDPIKGITALTRVGVSFDAEQKKLIAGYVKHGQVAKAQGVILKELSKEFGGAAKAAGAGFAGSLARAKDAMGDAFRSVGQELLPFITKAADWFAKGFPTWFAKTEAAVKSAAAWLGPKLRAAFAATIPMVQRLWAWLSGSLWPALKLAYTQIMPAVRNAINTVRDAFKNNSDAVSKGSGILKAIGIVITQVVIPAVSAIAQVWLPMMAAQWAAVAYAMNYVVLPAIKWLVKIALLQFGMMVHGIALAFGWLPGIGPKLKDAAKKFDAFAKQVNNALDGIQRNVNINFTINGRRAVMGSTGRVTVSGFKVGMQAGGGPARAGRFSLVGEQGPELVQWGGNGTVIPAPQTAAMLGGGSGGGDTYIVNAYMLEPTAAAGRAIVQAVQRAKTSGAFRPAAGWAS